MNGNKVMLITGTRKGIGNHLVQYYVKKGFTVIGCSRADMKVCIENYEHYLVDITDEKSVISMVKDINQKYGRLDVLLNNAGIASMNHFLLMPTNKAMDIINTNVIGTFNVSREASKLMLRQQYGRIVNFGSVAVPLKIEGEAMYAASKSAIVSMSQILAKELAPYNITCNVIGPAPINTDLIRGVPKEKIEKLLENLAIHRLCKYDDITNVLDFFIKDESSYITGQVLYLGGV